MSQVTQPRISLPIGMRSGRTVLLGALLALAASAAVVLILTLGNESSDTTAVSAQAPALRSDGGPEETGVAAAVKSRPAPGPDESRIAASIGTSSPQVSSGPDESRIAASVGGSSSPGSSGPDESRTAASISGR